MRGRGRNVREKGMESQRRRLVSGDPAKQWWVRETPNGVYMSVYKECVEEAGYKCVYGPATFAECDKWINQHMLAETDTPESYNNS